MNQIAKAYRAGCDYDRMANATGWTRDQVLLHLIAQRLRPWWKRLFGIS